MPKAKKIEDMPDVQNDTSGFPFKKIKKVGIRNVIVPLKILRKDGTINIASGNISIYTDLIESIKGANMSRYRILVEDFLLYKDLNLRELIREILPATKEKLGASNSYIKIKFDYFLIKEAPVSKTKSFSNYECIIEGKLNGDKYKYYLMVKVPYTSLCPCSKRISEYGAHNQRSFAEVKVELIDNKILWIEDIVDIVEKNASAPIINTLKRNDEAYQTELMYENPRFVEDMCRLIGNDLDKHLDKEIKDYVIVVEHQESIHSSDAISVMTAGRELQ